MTAVATICVTSGLLAEIVAGRTLSLALGFGLFTVFVLFTILVWTRWGQARPISKCIALSLMAHLLLLIYGFSTHILAGPPGRWNGQAVTMRIRDASDPIEAAPVKSESPKPWNQAGEANAPLLLANAENKQAEPEPEPASPAAEPPPAAVAAEPVAKPPAEAAPPPEKALEQPVEQPQLTDLLPDQGPKKSAVAAQDPATASPPPVVAQEMQPAPPLDANGPLPSAADDSHFVTATRRAVARRLGDGLEVPEPLQARVASNRLQAAQPFGATAQTESAVAAALDWLAANQSPDGRWDADNHGAGQETAIFWATIAVIPKLAA